MAPLWYGVLLAGGIVLAVVVLAYRPYRSDVAAAYERLDGTERDVIETACGPIEYAIRGDGPPVLLIHGISGGVDQALVSAAAHLEGGRVIAPSRFGYLGTPMPQHATPASQADAFACLLAELEVERTAVVAYSAGGASAIQLALRHPEQVTGLVLVGTAPSGEELRLPPRFIVQRLFGSDLAMWALTHPFRRWAMPMFGVPRGYAMTLEDEQEVDEVLASVLPMKPRTEGAVFDMYVSNPDFARRPDLYRLEDVAAPALLVNAMDDTLANHHAAAAASERFPDAAFASFPRGGHLFLGSGGDVRRVIGSFLHGHRRDISATNASTS